LRTTGVGKKAVEIEEVVERIAKQGPVFRFRPMRAAAFRAFDFSDQTFRQHGSVVLIVLVRCRWHRRYTEIRSTWSPMPRLPLPGALSNEAPSFEPTSPFSTPCDLFAHHTPVDERQILCHPDAHRLVHCPDCERLIHVDGSCWTRTTATTRSCVGLVALLEGAHRWAPVRMQQADNHQVAAYLQSGRVQSVHCGAAIRKMGRRELSQTGHCDRQ